jgi:enoyl-CoA hydratase/carnithine racemase
VLASALALANRIAANSPNSLRITKQLALRSAAHRSPWDDAVWALNAELNETVANSPDAIEGARAFAERRRPRWAVAES